MSDSLKRYQSHIGNDLIELERLDRVQRRLELPRITTLGLTVIVPVFLCISAFQRGMNGLSAKWWGISAGVVFVVMLFSTIVIHIVQWVYAKKIIRFLRDGFDYSFLVDVPIELIGRDGFREFHLEQSEQYVSARRPGVKLWRVHRILVMITGLIAFIGYLVVLVPMMYGNGMVYELLKGLVAAFMCVMTVWYARKQRFVGWDFDREHRVLSIHRLIGMTRSETLSYPIKGTLEYHAQPSGLFTYEIQGYLFNEVEGADPEMIPIPLDPYSEKTKSARDKATKFMYIIRSLLFLRLIDQSIESFDFREMTNGSDRIVY